MKVLLDTNIIIDLLDVSRPGSAWSLKFFDLCTKSLILAHATTLTFTNAFYIIHHRQKLYTTTELQAQLDTLSTCITFEPTYAADLHRGFTIGITDYEDALQAICAERISADYIITNNVKDFKNSLVPAISPQYFFEHIFVGAG